MEVLYQRFQIASRNIYDEFCFLKFNVDMSIKRGFANRNVILKLFAWHITHD